MINEIKDLHHMLLFALRISRDCADIVEIHPPFHAGFRSFFRFMFVPTWVRDAMIFVQDLPDRACVPVFQVGDPGSQGSAPPPLVPIPGQVASLHATVRTTPPDHPADDPECASTISSSRVWSGPRLPPAFAYSSPDVPATPPSIYCDPRSIALPSQPSTFVFPPRILSQNWARLRRGSTRQGDDVRKQYTSPHQCNLYRDCHAASRDHPSRLHL